jgi:Tfp pilus assembly protein PilF
MDHPEKINQLSDMVDSDPDDPLTRYLLGMEYMHLGDHSNAVAAFRTCIALKPNYTAAVRMLADAYRKSGDLKNARAMYEKAIQVAGRTGDLQVKKEAQAILKKMGP